jgi:hypothetical protein
MDGNDDEYLPDWDFQSIYGREALAARRQGMPRRRARRGSRVPRPVGAPRGTAPGRAARPAAFFCHPSAV